MKRSEFIKEITEYCEFEGTDIQMGTVLRSIEGFDSMAILSIVAFADEKFGVKLSTQQISSLSDLESLGTLLGTNKFEDD